MSIPRSNQVQEMTSEDIDRLIREKHQEIRGMHEARGRDTEDSFGTKRRREMLSDLQASDEQDKIKFGRARSRERPHSRDNRHFDVSPRGPQDPRSNSKPLLSREERNLQDFGPQPASNSLSSAISLLQDQVSSLNKENSTLHELVEAMRSDASDRDRTVAEMQAKIDQLLAQIEEAKSKNRKLEDQSLLDRHKLDALEEELRQARQETQHVEAEMAKLLNQQMRVMQNTEEELAQVRSEEVNTEARTHKLLAQLSKTEFDYGNKLMDLEDELNKTRRTAREAQQRAEKLAETLTRDREFLEGKITLEKEKQKDLSHNYEMKVTTLKEDLRLAEKDLSLLRKSQAFLEKRVAKFEKGTSDSDSLKSELKKLLGISVELTADIMSFAKGEKVMMPLFKAFQHRQLNIEKKYKQLRSSIVQTAGKTKADLQDPNEKTALPKKAAQPARSRSKVRSIEQGNHSHRSRSNSVASRTSKASDRSKNSSASKRPVFTQNVQRAASKGSAAKLQRGASRERSNSRGALRPDAFARPHERTQEESTLFALQGKRLHGTDFSIAEDSLKDFKASDFRGPVFYEPQPSSAEKNKTTSSLKSTLANPLQPQPSSAFPAGTSTPTREQLRRNIREAEDQVIALKKLYRDKLASGQTQAAGGVQQAYGSASTADFVRIRSELAKLSAEIEQKSESLLKMRKQLRETDASTGFKTPVH